MKLSQAGYKLLLRDEGLRLKAYQDTKGIWTIGIGFTHYPNGSPVKRGDTLTEAQVYTIFQAEEETYSPGNLIPADKVSPSLYTKYYMMWNKPAEIIQRRTRDCKFFTDNPADQSLYDSLYCLIYNIGTANWNKSSIRRYVHG